MNQVQHLVHTDIGAVAGGHEETTAAGAQILERGGNAVDAAIGMVLAACVVEGTLTSLGGGGFMLVWGPNTPARVLDFFVAEPGRAAGGTAHVAPWGAYEIPLDYTTLHFGTGPATVAVPGMPRGLARASQLWGRLPLDQVAEPALELATTGVTLTETQAHEHELMYELLGRTPHGRSSYAPPGGPHRTGDIFRQPELARAIELVAATDGETMYTGELASSLLGWSRERAARITEADLARYEVHEVLPMTERIADAWLLTTPRPSMGGGLVLGMLRRMLADRPSAASLEEWMARALIEVFEIARPPTTTAPDDAPAPRHEHPAGTAGDVRALDRDLGTRLASELVPPPTQSPHTTQISVIDGDGAVVSTTTTVGIGSGEFIPGTGIQLNNMLAEYDRTQLRPAGTRVASMMAPTVMYNHRTVVSIGSAGSDRIPAAIAQCLTRMAVEDMRAPEAIAAPRWIYDGSTLHAEQGMETEAIERLAVDHDIVHWETPSCYFGTANAAALHNQRLRAAGDPRRECGAMVM